MADSNVGFVGLGGMGSEMAGHLADFLAGENRRLIVHNRTKEKAEQLLKRPNVDWSNSPAEMASSCGVVMCMLADDAAVRKTFDSYLSGGPPRYSIFVDCSTVAPTTTSELVSRAVDSDVQYVSAPVFGRPDAVRAKKIVNVLAGPPAAKARVRPLVEHMGRGVMGHSAVEANTRTVVEFNPKRKNVGDEARLGHVMKLTGNFYIAAAIELIAEGMNMGERAGLSRDTLLEFYSYMLPGPIFEGYGARIAKDQFNISKETPGFATTLAMKDVSHIRDLARNSKAAVPVADIVYEHLQQAQKDGCGDKDWGSIALAVRNQSPS